MRIQQQADRFAAMSPEERASLKQRFSRWQSLTPERKAELRGQGYKILDAVFKPEQEATVKRNARSNDQPKE